MNEYAKVHQLYLKTLLAKFHLLLTSAAMNSELSNIKWTISNEVHHVYNKPCLKRVQSHENGHVMGSWCGFAKIPARTPFSHAHTYTLSQLKSTSV